MEKKELLTVPEFMSRYAISRTALYREVKAKRLQLIKRGRRSLIARKDAETWMSNLQRFNGEENA